MADRTRGAELEALTAIAAQVNCTQDLDQILRGALETTVGVMGVDAGEIFLIDEETGELMLSVRQGLSDAFIADESVIGAGECLCGLAVDSARPVIATFLADHPARSRATCLREGFQSVMCLPLRARSRVLGLLNVQSRSVREFSADDQELLTAIGNQIGIAVENARLIDDAEHRRATLDSVMRSLVDGLILLDRHGRMTYANPCAEVMLGLKSAELVGKPLLNLDRALAARVSSPPGALDRLLTAARSPAPDGDSQVPAADLAVSRPAGEGGGTRTTQVQARLFPIHDAAGGELGQALLLHDVTREKEVDRMKSQLLSTVSHELRTPLASIKGFATTLLRQDVDWDEVTRREFLAIIDEESDHLSELISNLLDMARIEAGTLRVEREPMEIGPVVRDTVETFRVMTHQHQFELLLPAQLPWVEADSRRVRQVLRNLIENAIKYSPAGGPVDVQVHSLPGEIQVGVSDRGIGIEPDHMARIFDRFYQVDSASTRKVGGSGLGLSICKAIVEAHNGRLWVESKPGVGSSFYFTLPIAVQTPIRDE